MPHIFSNDGKAVVRRCGRYQQILKRMRDSVPALLTGYLSRQLRNRWSYRAYLDVGNHVLKKFRPPFALIFQLCPLDGVGEFDERNDRYSNSRFAKGFAKLVEDFSNT